MKFTFSYKFGIIFRSLNRNKKFTDITTIMNYWMLLELRSSSMSTNLKQLHENIDKYYSDGYLKVWCSYVHQVAWIFLRVSIGALSLWYICNIGFISMDVFLGMARVSGQGLQYPHSTNIGNTWWCYINQLLDQW